MSVPIGKRSKSKLDVYVKAIDLATHTCHICSNEKHFPKRDRWILTNRIVEEALTIVKNVARANDVYVSTREDYIARRELQTSALASVSGLLTLMDIAYRRYSLKIDRMEYWVGLVVTVQELLRAWRNSDLQRYKHLLGEKGED